MGPGVSGVYNVVECGDLRLGCDGWDMLSV
jgi:hypothetical protein